MARKLRALVDVCALALLVVLDVRDVWFKVRWLGPDDRFVVPADLHAVLAGSDVEALALTSEGVPPSVNMTGWISFLGSCGSLTPLHGGHFQHALASNCLISGDRSSGDQVVADSLILTSDVRVDAVAWAACRLLHVHRRPPVCHEDFVTDFLRRYQLAAPHVGLDMMAQVMSFAEGELLGLLEVVSKSAPLSAVVCVSGFEFERANASTPLRSSTAVDTPLLYGCGSPNRRLSAFAGRFATALATLQADKAWLTMDDVTALDMHFRVRQNARVSYKVTEQRAATSEGTPATTSLVLETHAAINLSCSGVLFNLMVVLDLALLAVHAWSALELSRVVRSSRGLHSEPENTKAQMNRLSFFACSLARSTPVMVLTLIASGLSWLLVLPNSVVLQFSRSPTARLHAYMTMLRLWSLLLLLVNAVWDVVVRLNEKRAYYVASRTFVASWELATIVLCVFYLLRGHLFALRSDKHEFEHQRFVDASTFPSVLARSNAYGEEDFVTPDAGSALPLWTIYSRLAQLLLVSLLVVAVVLAARYAVFVRSRKRNGVVASSPSETGSASATKRGSFGATAAAVAGYTRLPLEELLDVPIRAKNLVRYGDNGAERALEHVVGSERFLWAAQHLAHGLLVEGKHFLRDRRGFLHALPAHLPADGRAIAAARDVDEDEEPSGSPKRRRYVSPLRQ
jgi:hypothetical protein